MLKNLKSYKSLISFILLIVSFLTGMTVGYQFKKPPEIISLQEFKDKHPFLSDNIYYENPNDTIISFKSLHEELSEYILGDEKRIGIYFEYLPTGTSIGINEDIELTGASLIKVPVVIGTYKLAEEEKINLNDSLRINESQIDTEWGTLGTSALGKEYKIKDLIYEAIVNSDNTAINALHASVNKDFPIDLYNELDLQLPIIENGIISSSTSPRQYSKILKALFFSSFLQPESSNEILNLMTEIKDGQALRADIPENIKISHKIGASLESPNPNRHISSDCGIVYVPKRPYILCMMTQEDKVTANKYMKTISNMVYRYVSTK